MWSFLDKIFLHPLATLFAIIALGLVLGKIKFKGLSLGASGVIFIALLFGHFHYKIPEGVGNIGLVLFVFCIGITAGPGFFSAFARKGANLAKLSIITVFSGAATTYLLARLIGIPANLASGLFAGALTSTPGLAAAMESAQTDPGMVSIGYGIAYPFGVVGVVLFIQLMPRLLGKDLAQEAATEPSQKTAQIVRVLVEVCNPDLNGKLMEDEMPFLNEKECCISRVLADGKLHPLKHATCFQTGQTYLLVGNNAKLPDIIKHIGREIHKEAILDADNERMQIAVTSKVLAHRSLAELQPLKNHGVIISRITRHDVTFVPDSSMRIEHGDLLTVVGTPSDLHAFAKLAGNKHKILHSTDIISLAIGITLGVILGMIPIKLPGLKTFSLGLAGGPLFVALIMGYFKHIGKLSSHMPAASKILLMELGLLFFLADAGIKAGGSMVNVLKTHGTTLFLAGAGISVMPMLLAYFIATKCFKMNILESLGAICGGMTSTPALGALSAKVDSDTPVACYATAYPVALILMTLAAQLLLSVLE